VANRRPSVISLFSGALGLDLGLERAGFRVAVAVECNRHAAATIRHNRPRLHLIEQRLECVPTAEILGAAGFQVGEATVVTGGPSCQAFSTAGNRLSVRDPRGTMFRAFLRGRPRSSPGVLRPGERPGDPLGRDPSPSPQRAGARIPAVAPRRGTGLRIATDPPRAQIYRIPRGLLRAQRGGLWSPAGARARRLRRIEGRAALRPSAGDTLARGRQRNTELENPARSTEGPTGEEP